MKRALPAVRTGLVLIFLVDSLGSIASRQLNFNYGYLMPLSLLIYAGTAFIITKRINKSTAIISSGLLGLFDATVGWKLSILLDANTGNVPARITPVLATVTVLFVIITSIFLGLLGSWLALKFTEQIRTR